MLSRRISRYLSLFLALALLAAPLRFSLATVNGGPVGPKTPAAPSGSTSQAPIGAFVMVTAVPAQDPNGKGGEMKIDVEKLTAEPKAVGEKLYLFMRGGGYIAESASGEKDFDARMKALVVKWTEEKIKAGGAARQAVAELVYVIDLGKEHEKNKLLLTTMQVWTKDPEAGKQNPGNFVPGQLKGSSPDKWADEFLTSAAIHARKALNENRAPGKIKEDIVRVEEKDIIPVSLNGQGHDPLQAMSEWQRTILGSGIVMNVFQKGDPTSRKIFMTMATSKQPDGFLADELRIYDITNPGDVFYQSYAIAPGGGVIKGPLDDRTAGKREYKLTMQPNTQGELEIVFARPDSKGEGTITTTFSDLMRLRAAQAVNAGQTKTINGQNFYVLGQLGETGDKLFFPAAVKDHVSGNDMNKLRPSNMAVGLVKNTNGRDSVMTGAKPDLGKIGGKPYHMAWVEQPDPNKPKYPGYFDVFEGEGDKPATNPPTGSTGTTPSPNPNPNDPDLENRYLNSGYYALNPKAYEGAPEGRLRILSATEKGILWLLKEYPGDAFSKMHVVVIPDAKPKRIANVSFMPKPDATFTAQKMFIHDHKYFVTVSDGGTLYMDLGSISLNEKTGFSELGGVMADDKKTVSKITSKSILPHALNVAGFDGKEIAVAMKNLETVLKDATVYTIDGSRTVNLVVKIGGGKPMQFWPEIKDGPASDGSHTDTKTGNAYDAYKGAGPLDEKFPEAPTLDGMKLAKIKDVSDAVIYVNEVPAASATKEKPRRYYMLVGFNNKDQKMRTAFMNVFNVGDGTLEPPAGDKFDIAGLLHVKFDGDLMTSGMEPRVVSPQKKDPTKGLYGMFATRASAKANTKDPATNCLGPVVWWGMTKDQAVEACKKNAL